MQEHRATPLGAADCRAPPRQVQVVKATLTGAEPKLGENRKVTVSM
jgi:hypothetical protein